ncbi:MAG: terminase large subunit [Betaproteobacteria bacterium]|nr:terminase large subunit [Betaproteobacteria bacterium]
MSYSERATDYAQRVASGREIAGKFEILACKRFLRDLDRGIQEDWPFCYGDEQAERACAFIEQLPHIKGRWARQRLKITLEDWQCFIVCNLFGWLSKATGLRRFTTGYLEVARKNAKSTLAAGIGLYMLAGDGESGAEVYSVATTGDQARIVFDVARQMVLREAAFAAGGIDAQIRGVYLPDDARKFEPLNAEGSTLDGLNPHCCIVDELHAHKRRDVYDVVDTARGAREQSLLLSITTAGTDRAGICYEQRTYVVKMLEGVFDDDTYFGIVYTIDDGDDWRDPAVWRKANPNYGVSVLSDDFERSAREAMNKPSALNNFLTKRLNVWVNADSAWMDMRAWDACADQSLQEEDFAGTECIASLDLASKVDIAAKAKVYRREGRYFVFMKYYLPEAAAEDGRNSQYSGWAKQGLLTLTPGNVTDFDQIEADLIEDASRCDMKEVPFDPFQAMQLSNHLIAEGLPMVEMRPTVLNFSEPMKELEALVLKKQLTHDGDPILAWMVSNVVCHRDQKDNIYPRKEREENKIDGVVALIMALGRWMVRNSESGSVIDSSYELMVL